MLPDIENNICIICAFFSKLYLLKINLILHEINKKIKINATQLKLIGKNEKKYSIPRITLLNSKFVIKLPLTAGIGIIEP